MGSLGAKASSLELTGHLGPTLAGPRPRGTVEEKGRLHFLLAPWAACSQVQGGSLGPTPTPTITLGMQLSSGQGFCLDAHGHLHWPSLGTRKEGGSMGRRRGRCPRVEVGGYTEFLGDGGAEEGPEPSRVSLGPQPCTERGEEGAR